MNQKSIADLGRTGLLDRIVICGVERDGEMTIPAGDFIFEEGDMVSFSWPLNMTRRILCDALDFLPIRCVTQ